VQLVAELEPPVQEVVVRSEGIRLGQLLKLAELVQTGSEGKELLAAGGVEVNGESELRRGRQLVNGDVVVARDRAVRVALES
jgi:ribosome-associated protein